MSFVSPSVSDLSGPIYLNFRKCLQKRPWSTSIDYSRPSRLPAWKQDLAFAIATQACHAEHLGMCTAAQLVLEAPSAQLQFAFAAAAQDEASHSEALGRYAVSRGGRLDSANEHHASMVDPLLGRNKFVRRAMLHVLLEGFALDQFKAFAKAFEADLLGEIYVGIREDEARHVALGMVAIQYAASQGQECSPHDLDLVEHEARALGGLGDDLYDWLATIEEVPISAVRSRYESNHATRIRAIRDAFTGGTK